ncbi:MAG: bifunctional hydroxymethylpyrimidine kinase/phosphomethylpyrimidine kinase [Desulfobacteraceae bacterium]|nr:MAG: bifunctional hydroxymethylpyrimidine kinase/phosphomethylpyrimidine kinase [Desulfobacteraceae bacterium]
MKYILVIAGSDSCGGAGIQADIKTITGLGAHALTAITALTAQNSLGITAIHKVPARFISKQLEAIMDDLIPDAVKIGMLYSKTAVMEVARLIKKHGLPNVVLDPVLSASTGRHLLEPKALSLLKEVLIPITSVVTPNLYEAEILADLKVWGPSEMANAAKVIRKMGPDVVITGGHLEGECMDLLYDGSDFHRFCGSRINTKHTHGSGCVFSTALATYLTHEKDVVKASKLAHEFTRCAIINGYACGRGPGPVQPG